MTDQYAVVSLMFDCPSCTEETRINVEALITSGLQPKARHRCFWCGKHFDVSAHLSVSAANVEATDQQTEAHRTSKQITRPE